MEGGEKIVIEGLVSIARVDDTEEKTVYVWNPRPDKASNLADFIEAAFGSEGNVGLYGPMRFTIESLAE
jgi:D-hexose-6-phosphate mutarotase